MKGQTPFKISSIGISISESPDMGIIGLNHGHLRSAAADIATHMLASGYNLAYGGDLREKGFTQLLFELVSRYTPEHDERGDKDKETSASKRIVNYLAWPVHISMEITQLNSITELTRDIGKCLLLNQDGTTMTIEQRRVHRQHEPDEDDWSTGLTNMRMSMLKNTQARILLGGRVEGYKGRMPGIAEEALISMKAAQPTFILGGFGGAARDVAESINIATTWQGSRINWAGKKEFEEFGPESLKNGLSYEENQLLATTPHISISIPIILKGIRRTQQSEFSAEQD